MREAFWAEAGMLAAENPENPQALRELALLSRGLDAAYLDSIERLSVRSIPANRGRFAAVAPRPELCLAPPPKWTLRPSARRFSNPPRASAEPAA